MTEVVGHLEALARLPATLPPVLLLLGPEGVGKNFTARSIISRAGVAPIDFQQVSRLLRPAAREVQVFHESTPVASEFKVSLIDLTNATSEALNSTLRLLEAPPPYSRFVLHSDKSVTLTVRSRAFVVEFGALKLSEVSLILDRLGQPSEEAAKFSQGSVAKALEYLRHEDVREAVERLLEAVLRRDTALVRSLMAQVLDDAPTMACLLLREEMRKAEFGLTPLAQIPRTQRSLALRILDSQSRVTLKFRSAIQSLEG